MQRMILVASLVVALCRCALASIDAPMTVRIATFNIEDVREEDVARNDNPRLKAIAEVIQRIAPNIIFLNEIAYDMPGAPGFKEGDAPGQNAARFVENYLSTAQAPGLTPIKYRAFMAPVNTGLFSGFDLDNDGKVVDAYPMPPGTKPDGTPGGQTPEGRAYGNDCFGFGTFPGQYGMALLVDERLTIDEANIRTFQKLPWDYVTGNFLPMNADGTPWYSNEEKAVMRLSSKSHWDVPVRLPNGSELHVFCSHPTPPVFDGPEDRNGKRNHDEIRFWMDYLSNEPYIVDDNAKYGGYASDAPFVIVGDMNADPKKGDSFKNPMFKLLGARRLARGVTPSSEIEVANLEPTDTSLFKMRVDYVLPSKDLKVVQSGIWRALPAAVGTGGKFPSDHFPVWVDVIVPPGKK
ncbi:MAG: endonuclease/exonuclease/phosphatase family protein [Phycisphaeraceae bacterium]|nr:endonuclease/exonuclease/phosphatase family protein [Phycisphaeraceae bacterium]